MSPIMDGLSIPAFIPSLGWPELVIILVIVLVIFGPKKLPGIGKAIGQSIRELKKSSNPKEDKKEEK
ncbi:twin-arginine translocase TatA/TatE family subunit [Candidatus Aquicultor secundus]|uniref:twin-arginine translocase TatA/TatE family subunit n=2 Tax=Candidatus Aquicultor secundus TaxID=1973895 RepID=UPI00257B5D1C|nr:twin-arginine translocase TatA/TatE family subunit [Candidatus Aquicultor secundus]